MTLVDELIKNKEEILIKILQFLEGKEAATKISLHDMKFTVSNMLVKLNGEIEVSAMRLDVDKKKK